MSDDTVTFMAGLFLGLVFGALIAWGLTEDSWKDEAVAKGYAEYYLDQSHNKHWRWKP